MRKKGDIVTCENGHRLYKLIRDIIPHERIMAAQFKSVHKSLTNPKGGDKIGNVCPDCGAEFVRQRNDSVRQFHFEYGWH